MNITRLRELIKQQQTLDNESIDCYFPAIYDETVEILNENLSDTITFLDTCTEEEFYWIGSTFSEVSDKYKSEEFIECIKRNMLRFPNIITNSKTELKYAIMAMEDNE